MRVFLTLVVVVAVIDARASATVVSVSPPASDVGLDVLKRGGNAVDAAVATAFALAVTWPEAGNIGGGGFMMVAPGPGREVECIEYRETAPAAATRTMFAPGETNLSHRAIGVPGTVAGMALAHRRFGRLKWREVVSPAVELAERGFTLNAATAKSLNGVLQSKSSARFAELHRVYGRDSGKIPWNTGDRLVQPELAKTLRLIADTGPAAFYTGTIARQIVDEMRRGGGLITLDDLANYRAYVRRPVHGTYRGYDIYAPPPPSSGGVCLVQMLNVLEQFDLKSSGRWSPQTCHLMIEAMRRAYCDRARHLGDPDFTTIPDHLVSKEHARALAASIDLKRATPSDSLAPEIRLAPESEQTTHFSIVDRDGMAVANTYTLEESFGSRVVVRGAGFLLNNEMGDFNWQPGVTDRRGGIGTEPNTIVPGKRMLSSQTPTLVMRDGRVVLVTGSPGGRTIINTVLQVVLNVAEFQMPIEQAVAAPRFHHGWFPDHVQFERSSDPHMSALPKALESLGHRVRTDRDHQGDAHTILVRGAPGAVPDRRINRQSPTAPQ